MLDEPVPGHRSHTFQCPRLLEQMGCAGDDLQTMDTVHASRSPRIQIQHGMVLSADNQQSWGFYFAKRIVGQIWTSAARHYSCDLTLQSGRSDERSCGSSACTKEADRKVLQVGLMCGLSDRQNSALGKQLNVKTKLHGLLVNVLLFFG